MNIKITGNGINGEISAIPSKSDVHRALICAALADEKSTVSFNSSSKDIQATISCLKSLGAEIVVDENGAEITPLIKNLKTNALLNCEESGSTLRFMLPISAALGAQGSFTGHGRLSQRPLDPLCDVMKKNGCDFSAINKFPLKLTGKLRAGNYEIRGDVSSQFITGLLLSLPISGLGGKITVIAPIESKKYIDMTVETMRKYAVDVQVCNNTYTVLPNQKYKIVNKEYNSDGDWSNAAFFLTAAAINGRVKYQGVYKNSLQGDQKIVELLKQFGADVKQNETSVEITSAPLKGIDIDASQIPDLVPTLAVAAAFAKGETKIYNASRLRLKESDRLLAIAQALNSVGASVKELDDGLIINGSPAAKYKGTTDSFNDHRMVMSMAVAAVCSGEITIQNAQAVEKSYPLFFKHLESLGGKCNVL